MPSGTREVGVMAVAVQIYQAALLTRLAFLGVAKHPAIPKTEFYPVASATATTYCILSSSALHPAPLGCSSLPFGDERGTVLLLGRHWQRGMVWLPHTATPMSLPPWRPSLLLTPPSTITSNDNIEAHLLVHGLAARMSV